MKTITIKNHTLSYMGDASMLLCPMTTFLCSHRVPEGVTDAIHQWVNSLDAINTCIVCGNLTSEERLVRRLLLKRGIPVALALANAIPDDLAELKLNADEHAALDTGRMVIISPIIDATIKDASGKTSAARNLLMIAIATRIVVGFMSENGNLAHQLLGARNVKVLYEEGQDLVRENDAQKAQDNALRMGWAIYRRLKGGHPEAEAGNEKEGDMSSPSDVEAIGVASPFEASAAGMDTMPWETPTTSVAGSTPLSSQEMRQLLSRYLKLEDIEKPSLLHSLLLFQVVRHYSHLADFNFTAFFRLWGPENLRQEDWKATKTGEIWLPSLAERVMSRLFKAMPSRFHEPVNRDERFDPQLAHVLLDEAFRRAKNPNKRLCQRALNLAYFEHDSEAIAKYREVLGKDAPQQ